MNAVAQCGCGDDRWKRENVRESEIKRVHSADQSLPRFPNNAHYLFRFWQCFSGRNRAIRTRGDHNDAAEFKLYKDDFERASAIRTTITSLVCTHERPPNR